MVRFLYIFLLATICACHSQKAVTCTESALMTSLITIDSASVSQSSVQEVKLSFAESDSFNISFSADSITIKDASIYKPVVSLQAIEPRVKTENHMASIHSDSISRHVNAEDSTDIDMNTETANPPRLSTRFAFITLAAAMVIIALLLIRTKIHLK